MSVKLTNILKNKESTSGVDPTIREYERRSKKAKDSRTTYKEDNYQEYNDLYYDLVTDFYEYGWGTSFHFAPRSPGESFENSQLRHQHYMADKLGLSPGMVVADLGCGIAGPLLGIARHSGAKIVGVNSNAYQLERAAERTEEAGLTDQVEFLHCDFLNVDAPDESFDAIYAIEATCCAPDKTSVYGEAFRLLKPGGVFGTYEWCMTGRFDARDPRHRKIKADIQLGAGLLILDDQPTAENALRTVGFELVGATDLALSASPSIPWHQPLVRSGYSLIDLRKSAPGRWATHQLVKVLQALRIAPQGSVRVSKTLNIGATALAKAGKLGIFTPMHFLHGRKPASRSFPSHAG